MTGLYLIFVGTLLNLNSNEPKGVYGGDGKTAPLIELRSDKTFHYLDLTNKNHPIDISGTWKMSGHTVRLLNVSQKGVMKDLEITREGKCLKARKKFAFYTLCNCN